MISGSVATSNVYALTQGLPTCIDPTGHNLPCMMVISTLPAPTNALQCQETSGQILTCSYVTQTLNNGDRVVVITVYVPPDFVFSNPTVVKVLVHKTTTKIIREIIREHEPSPICKGIQGVHGCIIFMPGGPGQPPIPIYLTPLPKWCASIGCRTGWFDGNTGGDPYNPFRPGSQDWAAYNFAYGQGVDRSTPYTNCEHFDTCGDPKYDPTHDPKYKPQSQPTSCIVAGVDYCSQVTSPPLLPALLGPLNTNTSKGGGATTPTNVSIAGPQAPMNFSSSTSGKHGGSKSNYNNLTKQGSLQLPSPPPPQITKCQDGSLPDSNGKCPATQSPPTPNPTTPSTPPSGSNNGGGGSSSGSGGSGSSSGGGSGPSQPTTVN
jgi:hypothetical protein